jgi:hypothetical protein
LTSTSLISSSSLSFRDLISMTEPMRQWLLVTEKRAYLYRYACIVP